jgi:hypothetical protein
MTQYNITLSSAEDKALSYTAVSQQNWINNAVHERCRIAIDEIAKICVEQCLASNIQIPGSKDAMVDLAFQNGWVISAADKQVQIDAQEKSVAMEQAQSGQTEGA